MRQVAAAWAALTTSLLLLPLPAAQAAEADVSRPVVLVLNSYHPGYTWSDHEVEGIREVLEADPGHDVSVEYMDTKTFPDEHHLPELLALLTRKYAGRRIELLLACDNPALAFALENRERLAPGAAIVFCGINGFRPEMLHGHEKVTGLAESLDVGGTLDAALRLCPQTRRVVVLHDFTVTGLGSRRDFDAVAPRFADRVGFEMLPQMRLGELLDRVERLPADTIVLALSYSRDRDGLVLDHTRIAELLSQHSAAPVFVVHAERLGRGVVGGLLLGGEEHGREAAHLARRVLAGEDPDHIPVQPGRSTPMFDYAGLLRWGIPDSALPPHSVVINPPESFYRKYRSLVWGTLALVGVLVGLVLHLTGSVLRRRRAGMALDRERVFLQTAMDGLPDPVFVLSTDHQVRLLNHAARELVATPPASVAGSEPLLHTAAACPDRSQLCPIQEVDQAGGAVCFERRHVLPGGEARDLVVSAAPLRQPDGEVAVIASAHDITDLKRAHAQLIEKERRLEHLAQYDALTGLPNRMLFEDRLEQAITRAQRARHGLALLFLDLDHFKNVNDMLGHETGDQMLKAVADRLRACIRAEDTVARLGGDEFTVLIEGPVDGAGAAVVARKILHELTRPFPTARNLYAGASIGISLFPGDGDNAETLIRSADVAMYLAKERGRGSYQFFTETLNLRVLRQMTVENRLRRALADDGLRVHFQPLVDLASRRIVGAEALLRWTDAELGVVAPAEFIPVAEETGLIAAIGESVLREACQARGRWQAQGFPDLRVAVNISARQFWHHDILASVGRVLDETRLPAHWLELEVTESILLPGTDEAIGLLGDLRRLGVRLSVDDFGTGYSSLGYLKRLPLHSLKVAQEFVRDIHTDPSDAAIVRAILSMAQSLGFQVIAEGVETAAHADFFQAHGCDLMQGFFFSPAVCEADFLELLRAEAVPAARN